ncbi:MAG TPA: PH domain-containing protein, partial [Gammaproteobacteria bacterium]
VDDEPAVITWRLEVTGECPGPDFWSRFELPVFTTSTEVAPAEPTSSTASLAHEWPEPAALDALGIDYERLPQGGEAWTFRRGQNKRVATGISAFAALWTAISGVLFFVGAPLLFPIVFSAFDALLIWWALQLWLTEYRVTLDRGLLTLSRRGFMARAPVEIPVQWIRAVQAKVGMQAGNKLYYDLKVDTADGSHIAASALADYDAASWLARHWMAARATVQR